MLLSRRQFVARSAAATALLGTGVSPGSGNTTPALTARSGMVQLAPSDYPMTEVWGYDGLAPGPVLRFKQGERLQRQLINELKQPTSIHWHGIRIDNAMDGVPGLTQDAVQPGGNFTYDFPLPDAGSYWYHAHWASPEQVGRGLHGALVVEEPEAPEVDRDEVLVLDDWRLNPEDAQIMGDFDNRHDLSHAGRYGNIATSNGQYDAVMPVKQHERLRLRLMNVANARIFTLALKGLEGWVMALDGMPLPQPEMAGTLTLAPGQRIDLIVDVTASEEAVLARMEPNGEGWVQVTFPVRGQAAAKRRSVPAALPPNPNMSTVGLNEARAVDLVMEGGAMGGMGGATFKGQDLGMRDLVQQGQFWAFNGTSGRTDTPLARASLGEAIKVKINNQTAFAHAMHLHGMHFREVLPNGYGPMRDTLLVNRAETREIAFVADNPGKWLFHCHMLGHAASGMNSWIEVT